MDAPAYFRRTGPTTFAPTPLAGGAWSDADYHFSPLGGLLVRCLREGRAERAGSDPGSATAVGGGGLQPARVSFDILGRLPFEEVEVRTEVLRPGRTIELAQATARIAGRDVVTARAWFLAASDTADVAGTEEEPLPVPYDCPVRDLTEVWSGGFIAQLEGRQARTPQPGRGAMWVRSDATLVSGEPTDPVAEYVALVDAANGVAVRRSPDRWAFPNVDLTVHLVRQPRGRWTGLDVSVDWGATGLGVTSSVLHDQDGPVGRAEQSLTLRRA